MNKAAKRKSPFRYFEKGTYFWKTYRVSLFVGLCFSGMLAIMLFAFFPSFSALLAGMFFVLLASLFSFVWATTDTIFTRWFISYKWKIPLIVSLSRIASTTIGVLIFLVWSSLNSFSEHSSVIVIGIAALLAFIYLLAHFVVTYFTTNDYLKKSVEKTYSANNHKEDEALLGPPFGRADGAINRLDKKLEGI
jgi:hypothetical protein